MDKIVKIVGGVLVLGLVVGLVAWLTHDGKRQLPPVLKELSDEVALEFAEKLPRNRQVNDLLVIVPRSGNQRDEEIRFREILKDRIIEARKYNVQDWTDVKKKVDDGKLTHFLNDMLGLVPGDDPKNLEQAKKVLDWLAKANMTFDGVLVVNIQEFEEGDDGLHAKVAVTGDIYGVAAGKTIETVPPVVRSVDSVFNYTYLHHRLESMSLVLRFLGWFLVAATLPFALIQLVRAVVTRRKNELNLALVAVFTGFDVLLAWILISAISVGLGSGLFVLVLTALMGYYNYDACDYIERRLT